MIYAWLPAIKCVVMGKILNKEPFSTFSWQSPFEGMYRACWVFVEPRAVVWWTTAKPNAADRRRNKCFHGKLKRHKSDAGFNSNATTKLPSRKRSPLSSAGSVWLLSSCCCQFRNSREPYSYAPTVHKVSIFTLFAKTLRGRTTTINWDT